MCYQGTFCIITAALISGAIVERMRFSAYVTFITLWSVVVYGPVAHWVWGGGWLSKMGALDFAGGTVVHVNAGVAALVAAIVVGKRRDYPSSSLLPHNVPFVLLGAGLLWFGWFGFNAGSALAANGIAALAFTATFLAPMGTLVVWTLLDMIRSRRSTAVGCATAIVVGLVAITPAAGFVGPMSAIALGALAAFPSYFALVLRAKTSLDDSLDVVAAHGVGGTVGAILTGVFAQKALNGVADGLLFGNPAQVGHPGRRRPGGDCLQRRHELRAPEADRPRHAVARQRRGRGHRTRRHPARRGGVRPRRRLANHGDGRHGFLVPGAPASGGECVSGSLIPSGPRRRHSPGEFARRHSTSTDPNGTHRYGPFRKCVHAMDGKQVSTDGQNAPAALLEEARRNIGRDILAGEGGVSALARYAAHVDDRLRQLHADAGPSGRSVALIAIGGYGRRHLCPFSDIDLLVLFDGAVEEEEERFLRRLLHPLWDAGFVVGHQVRDAAELAKPEVDNPEFLLALTDARLVTGDAALFDRMLESFHVPRTHAHVLGGAAGVDRDAPRPVQRHALSARAGREGRAGRPARHLGGAHHRRRHRSVAAAARHRSLGAAGAGGGLSAARPIARASRTAPQRQRARARAPGEGGRPVRLSRPVARGSAWKR